MDKLLLHEFTGRFVNGERICKWCAGTPRECAFVFGPLCDKRPRSGEHLSPTETPAQCEASQSGPNGATHNPTPNHHSSR